MRSNDKFILCYGGMHLNDEFLVRLDKKIIRDILLNDDLVVALVVALIIWRGLRLSN